jgi:hypothetical protein
MVIASGQRMLEIACDESGYEGEKLIGSSTDVFAHGSVDLGLEPAAEFMQELRNRIRSPAQEYKATHLLRERHRRVLDWALGPAGPIIGHAHVFLVDKVQFVLGGVLDVLLGDPGPAAGLRRDGCRAFGREAWDAFLVAGNDLLRTKDRQDATTSVEAFYAVVEAARADGARSRTGEVVERLGLARDRAEAFRAHLRDDPRALSPLDPLIPAIMRAAAFWGLDGSAVSIVHDQQNFLSTQRLAALAELLGGTPFRLADSFTDPRIQAADVIAGVVRKIASEDLNGRGEPALVALARPYVDTQSVWGDARSWARLAR